MRAWSCPETDQRSCGADSPRCIARVLPILVPSCREKRWNGDSRWVKSTISSTPTRSRATAAALDRRRPVGEATHRLPADQAPGYCRGTGQAVNQAQLQGLLTGPDQSTEQIRMLLQPITPPLAHLVDELTVGGIQYRLPELPLILALGLEGIEEGLVLTGGIGA